MLIKKIPDTISLVTTTVLNTKLSEVENKTPNTSSLVTTTVLNTKISEVENKILNQINILLILNLVSQQQKVFQQD